MTDADSFNQIDRVFIETSKLLKLDYIWPANDDEQKEKFLKGKIKNPKFLYRSLKYSPKEVEKVLTALKFPKGRIGEIYKKKLERKFLSNKIIAKRGQKSIVKRASIKLHGVPSKKLVNYAEKLLSEIPSAVHEKTVPPEKLKKAMEKALSVYNLNEWKIEYSDVKLAGVYPSQKKVKINKKAKYSQNALKRLVIHEIGVHVLRAANGYEQPFKIFALGLPGFLPTEEGLTTYFEETTGNWDDEKMRDYAGRVVAVDSVCKNLSFKKTFERLKEYKFTNGQAWRLAVRAHRGGGYIKDHVYLKGYLKVKDFAKKKGDFKTLYVGKVAIEDLPLVEKLLRDGILKKPKYLPDFLKSA